MAGLSIDTRANVAFKKLVGKAHTSNAIPFFSEAFASQVWIGSPEIVGEAIDSDPSQATNVQFVEADLQLIAAANGFAYNLRFPSGTTFKGNDVSGDLIRDHTLVVDQKNNLGDFAKSDNTGGYVYDLYDDGTRIPATSTKNWQLDPVAGIVQSEQTLDLGSTGTVRVYVYTGAFLSDVVGDIQGGDVSFTTDDIDEGSTNLYFTESRVFNVIDDTLIAGDGIEFDVVGNQITINADFSEIDSQYINRDGDTAVGDYDFNTGLFVLNQSANTITSDGDFTTTGTVTTEELIETSSAILKTNITPLGHQTDKLMQLEPVSYRRLSRPDDHVELGFIAEEVAKIYPEFVSVTDDGKVSGINYSKMVSVLVQGMKELNTKVRELSSELQTYKSK